MGCASSKQKRKRCRHCQSLYSPIPRSYSMHVHHPPQAKGDSYHVVALQSTTLGSLQLDFMSQQIPQTNNNIHVENTNGGPVAVVDQEDHDCNSVVDDKEDKDSKEFNIGLVEAKLWSNMIQQKIPKVVPKTPIRTPPGEPETINTWELMAGLEDVSPRRSPKHHRSFSFDVVWNENSNHASVFDRQKSRLSENDTFWQKMQEEENESVYKSFVSEFDPDVISSFKKSFEDLAPGHPFHLRPLECDERQEMDSIDGKKKSNGVDLDDHKKFGKEKVVVYFTSLRGVRKTYEDCCNVRVILKGLGVRIDERDVSMHSGFKDELRELLGDGFNKGGLLPKVFVGKKYIGGADEIRRMHEEGELEKLVEHCEMVDDRGGGAGNGGGACEACGDMRFVPCDTCSGSCKIYYEEEGDADEEWQECEESEYGFQRCPDCNENGLIRCPICCY